MDFFSKELKVINEVKYLATENTHRYRAIIKVFYSYYKRFSYYLYKEDIFEELKKSEFFENYNLDYCEQDISKLVEWGNITGTQDTSKVSTIEEFKNKKFRYQLDEKSIIIERMVNDELSKLVPQEASLDPNLLERIKESIETILKALEKENEVSNTWWNNLVSDFNRLTNNYNSYLSKLNSFKMEELMNTTQFLIYKDSMIEYLRTFVKGLQEEGYEICNLIKRIDQRKLEAVLFSIAEKEKSLMIINQEITTEDIYADISGKWLGINAWFIGGNGKKSEMEMLYDKTNEIIRKIVRIAMQIAESRKIISSRREDYLKAAQIFSKCSDINEAHCLSAVLFGAFNTKHIKGQLENNSKDKNISIYEYPPTEHQVMPRTRTYKEKTQTMAIIDKTHRKAEFIREEQKRREAEDAKMAELTKDGQVIFSQLDTISSESRKTLLRWIVRGIETPSENVTELIDDTLYRVFPVQKNETGTMFQVLMNVKREIVLNCDDGIFTMPDIIIRMKREVLD